MTQAPLPGERHLYFSFIDAIRQAKSYIYITTPYFIPDHRLYRALRLAEQRGVDVRILMPEKSNISLVDYGARSFFQAFLSKKIRLYLYDEMIHAKTAVIDGEWAMIGTLNMDNVSLRYNFECAVISTDTLCAEELSSVFKNDLAKATEVILQEWEKRPLLEKIKEVLVWPIRKLL
jgi:cardiolipin synthase A/B